MLFNSYHFIFFFLPLALLGFYLTGTYFNQFSARLWLVTCSLFFYTWWGPEWIGLLLGSAAFNYLIARWIANIGEKHKKLLLTFGIICNAALLGYFKYSNTLLEGSNHWFGTAFELHDLFLPLAISFFTFQQIAYLVDITKDSRKLELSPVNYLLFVSFFPQLIAGPIVHHKEVLPQFLTKDIYQIINKNLTLGFWIFSIGLAKKTFIADPIGVWVDTGFANYATLNQGEALAVTYLYGLQLYFDFSSYCDMAVGLAYLFNIRLPINFNSPYKAINLQDFWRRWHITLFRFLKNYIFIPLALKIKSPNRKIIAIMVTMLISGLWHGAEWWFFVWGFLHGIAMSIFYLWKKTNITLPTLLSRFLTINFCILSMIFFRSTSWEQAISICKTLLGLGSEGWLIHKSHLAQDSSHFLWLLVSRENNNYVTSITVFLILLGGYGICFFTPNVFETAKKIQVASIQYWLTISLIFTLGLMMISEHSPFIYFQF